jgi:hypothetical protein
VDDRCGYYALGDDRETALAIRHGHGHGHAYGGVEDADTTRGPAQPRDDVGKLVAGAGLLLGGHD